MVCRIKKGDRVKVISGKDAGKVGAVLKVLPNSNGSTKVVVEGINVAVVHKKPTKNSSGERLNVEKPFDVSNVVFIENDVPTKIGYSFEESKKIRISRKSKNKIG